MLDYDAAIAASSGRGLLRNKHSTDDESTDRVRPNVRAFTQNLIHALILKCLFTMTLPNPKP